MESCAQMQNETKAPRSRQSPRRPAPPLRLAWPGGGGRIGASATLIRTNNLSQSQQQLQQEQMSCVTSLPVAKKKYEHERERERPSIATSKKAQSNRGVKRKSASNSNIGNNGTCTMWVDKYAPTNDASQLCVAPKKVKEVQTWIETALDRAKHSIRSNLYGNNDDQSKLLILVGSPGTGKSTMMRVLASQMKLVIHEWNDSSFYRSSTNAASRTNNNHNTILSMNYQSPLNSFEEFLQSAGAGFRSVCSGPLLSISSSNIDTVNRKRSLKEQSGQELHEGQALILLEELPNLYNVEAQARFRDILGRHLKQSRVPTVLIFSDVCEGKHKPEDLERIVGSEHLYSPSTTRIVQCHPVTKAKMKKSLEWIAKKEGIDGLGPMFWEEMHLQSAGDLRHAIMTLQFQKSTNNSRKYLKQTEKKGSKDNNKVKSDRDTKLSTFHALGKLLYAKRKQISPSMTSASLLNSSQATVGITTIVSGKFGEERPPLAFNPELVMDQSDIGLGGALSFLEYHSPEFFTDVSELSAAFNLYSDAATFLDRSFQTDHFDSIFPGGYAASLAGRAVASHNRHPAPNKFRSFSAPKVFEVMRKRRGNEITMQQLCKRLTVGSQQLSLDANFGSSRSFVTNDLPFMRTILPGEVNTALDNLYSFVRPQNERTKYTIEDNGNDSAMAMKKEQDQILHMDDIVDDDSSVETVTGVHHTHRSAESNQELHIRKGQNGRVLPNPKHCGPPSTARMEQKEKQIVSPIIVLEDAESNASTAHPEVIVIDV